MRVRCAAHSTWTHYNSTMLCTILEEPETDNDTIPYGKNSTNFYQQTPKTVSAVWSNQNREKSRKESTTINDLNHQKALGKTCFKTFAINAEPQNLGLVDISPQSTQFHTNKSINEETSRDMASKLFPEFFAEQLVDQTLVETVSLKTESDPLVESWLEFYGRNG